MHLKSIHQNTHPKFYGSSSSTAEVNNYQDRLAGMERELEKANQKLIDAVPIPRIGKVRYGQRGAMQWPIFVWELIMEQLVNGSPPSAISDNIEMFVLKFSPTTVIDGLPSLWTNRRGRSVLLVTVQTLSAYRLAKADKWGQLFTDGTSRRQEHRKDLLISIEEDDLFK